jgi:deoxyinosine 3'endonuclease (endonuclease V)
MKKNLLLLLLTLLSLQFTAQEKEGTKPSKHSEDIEKKYELKLNAFNLIAFAAIDISFERLIDENSSYGVAVFYNFSDYTYSDIAFPKKFSITPYYRWFFYRRFWNVEHLSRLLQ